MCLVTYSIKYVQMHLGKIKFNRDILHDIILHFIMYTCYVYIFVTCIRIMQLEIHT